MEFKPGDLGVMAGEFVYEVVEHLGNRLVIRDIACKERSGEWVPSNLGTHTIFTRELHSFPGDSNLLRLCLSLG